MDRAAQLSENDQLALAAEIFDHFCSATTMRQILGLYRNMCDTVGLRPGPLNEFYPKLKTKIKNWKAQALWKKFDARAAHRVYNKGTSCNGVRVLVIGAGPCGLRSAIEAQLAGAKVVVVEKRDRISRNNVLHLWPFLITDLRNLGAKKFYGKFCAGSIDHISIRQLQCILLKVALLLGVEIHEGISFVKTIEPRDGCGWRAEVSPEDHAVSHYEFDVLIGADGKRNTLEGFRRKEFRGKLAIAITANFINRKTEAEAKAEEISGVAFIFNQSFFKELYHTTGIDLENIVYYKDETHYFVMTAKKHSLIDKGVIMQDYADPAELLSMNNVNTEKLLAYAKEAAEFSTKYQMPNLEFAVNHYGKPDVAMFDFTSMFAADNSCRITVCKNYRLLQCLVGDSLLEPFWPTGSGCARGFLSSMDAVYAIKLFANPRNCSLAVLAQRESIYRLLAQTTPENLHRDIGAYTLDPASRYPNLNKFAVSVHQVKHLLDTDDPSLLEQTFMDTMQVQAAIEQPIRRKRRTNETTPLGAVLMRWIKLQLKGHEFSHSINDVSQCFTDGKVLCTLIHRYRPDLVDLNDIVECTAIESNERAFEIIEKELGIPRVMTADESVKIETIDAKLWLTYLEQICEVFRGEIPHVKHPKLDFAELREKTKANVADFSRLLKMTVKKPGDIEKVVPAKRQTLEDERARRSRKVVPYENVPTTAAAPVEIPRRARKRRSYEKVVQGDRQKRIEEIETNRRDRQFRRRLHRAQQTQNFYKSLHMLQANTFLRENDSSTPFEDYSLYVYRQSAPEFNDRVKELERKLLYPDRERGFASVLPRTGPDEQFGDRIKSMEQRINAGRNAAATDKKPKDLLRAIGKIESNDWNIKQIEKKIEESKKTEVGKSKEKVPKWSREQFLARQNKMSKPLERQESSDEKFREIDSTIRALDKQLKEGTVLETGERGKNKVASIAGHFGKKDDLIDEKLSSTTTPSTGGSTGLQKTNSKVGLVFTSQGVSEICHFCKQKVYLMEKISAEGLVLHRSCLKCTHCHTNLRLGGYAFDRDSPDGLFYCTQHFRLPAKIMKPAPKRRLIARPKPDEAATVVTDDASATPEKIRSRGDGISTLDLLDRGQTPERIEFEYTDALSDGEPVLENIIDENEWTDRNFGTGTDDSESDVSSSDISESEDENDDIFEEAEGSPLGAQTLQLATDWIGKRYSAMQDSDDDEFYDSSEDDEDDTQTEGDEEFAKARAIRMQEVKLQPPVYITTDTETEVQSDSDSSSGDVELNSATEISTDSEFDQDPIARGPPPRIYIDDTHLRRPTKVQVKSGIIENGSRHKAYTNATNKPITQTPKSIKQYQDDIHLEFKPLVQVDPSVLTTTRLPLKNPRPGDYLLNKTASTEGIASKKSLELKKRYLLGEAGLGSGIMKSGSTSILDSKFKNFHSNISECQKLLNPGNDKPAVTIPPVTIPKINEIKSNDINNIDNTVKNNSDEKENLYNNQLISNNKSNILDNNALVKKQDYSETINTALVENKINDINTIKTIDTINLLKNDDTKQLPIIDLTNIEIPNKVIKENQEFIEKMDKCNDGNKLIDIIDLTLDDTINNSDNNDVDIVNNDVKQNNNVETIDLVIVKNENLAEDEIPLLDNNNIKSVVPDILNSIINKKIDHIIENGESKIMNGNNDVQKQKSIDEVIIENGKTKPEITYPLSTSKNSPATDTNTPVAEVETKPEIIEQSDERPSSPVHETIIQVPKIIGWDKTLQKNQSDVESDSLSSSSSTSSLEEIPHYTLDSTTSPDTLPGDRFVPRVEVRDSSGELMQIDSLMIIDGKYVGDPEDLKLMEKLPAGTKIIGSENKSDDINNEVCNKTLVKKESCDIDKQICDKINEEPIKSVIKEKKPFEPFTKNIKYEPIYSRKPDLKFDTKNENKVNTLKNLPLIIPKGLPEVEVKQKKPTSLSFASVPTTIGVNSPIDLDKTPTATVPPETCCVSDSETEMTGQALTETELSDWTADDAVSENFVDIEFALNSNRGTIRRNKRSKKKSSHNNGNSPVVIQQSTPVILPDVPKETSKKIECGIMKNLDLDMDNIEFMDTGSEDSCIETYSTTNKALLKNRGYVEFVHNHEHHTNNYKNNSDNHYSNSPSPRNGHSVYKSNNEIVYALPILSDSNKLDLVEAVNKEVLGVDYIEQGACILNNDFDLKTPMNETPKLLFGSGVETYNHRQLDRGEQLDSLNDIEEDSLLMIASQTTTTTEDSDALTVVTSPLDALPKTFDSSSISFSRFDKILSSDVSKDDLKNSTKERSSDHDKRTSLDRKSDDHKRKISQERIQLDESLIGKNVEEIGYEEYVRKLQLKISQISNARDSIDIRKTKRKSSKGDLNSDQQSVSADRSLSVYIDKITEPPTVTSKLQEISKERTKQKDLIHDLVMDKLQSKKQLNAEKRLNRSRNRSGMFSPSGVVGGGNQVCSSSPIKSTSTPQIIEQIQHCHPIAPERRNSKTKIITQKHQSNEQQKERRHSIHSSPINTLNDKTNSIYKSSYKASDRPRSDVIDGDNTSTVMPKISKTKSFCVYSPRSTFNGNNLEQKTSPNNNGFSDNLNGFSTPIPPPRQPRKYDDTITNTEKMRQDAKIRARLKTNQELGLSPEEKIQLLRKRYNLDHIAHGIYSDSINKSDDVKETEKKLITSKSVNDINKMQKILTNNNNNNNNINNNNNNNDDLNIKSHINNNNNKQQALHLRTNNKDKDPERRKSIIQTVSEFFHKKKDVTTPPSHNNNNNNNHHHHQSNNKDKSEGMFGRFKISPKSKEKSKDKETPIYERSKSEDCLKQHQIQSNSSSPTRRDVVTSSTDDMEPPPIPPLPLHYQRSDDESYSNNENNKEMKKLQKAHSKASRQAELKRLRIAQEIQREQEEIEVEIKELETRGVLIEKSLRGEGQDLANLEPGTSVGANDDKLLKELLDIWRNITQLKKRDEELGIRQQELQLEHRHAQLKEELNMRLSCNKLNKSSSDVAAEGAILNEMLEIVAKRAALRPSDIFQQRKLSTTTSGCDLTVTTTNDSDI